MSFKPESLPYYNIATDRRVVFITGGNSGIGYHSVLNLYLHGFVVYMAGRDPHRMEKAVANLQKDAKAEIEKYTASEREHRFVGELHMLTLDLLDLSSIDKCVKQFKMTEKSLNVLILNAGIMGFPYIESKDGFDIQLQTSYISHFLLTDRLIPMLELPDVKDPRIVFLSSFIHWFVPFKFNLDSHFDYWPNMFWTVIRYAMGKCVGLQFTNSLAVKHPKVMSFSVHPGLILETNLMTHLTAWPILGQLVSWYFKFVQFFLGVSMEEGCLSTIKCAASDELDIKKDNGKYFTTGGVEGPTSSIARNKEYAAENWAWTVKKLEAKGYHIDNL